MEPWKPVGKEEETGGDGGLRADNEPSVQARPRRRWVASPCSPLTSAGGRLEASREAAARGCVSMPVDPGTSKGPSKGIFEIHLQTVSLFYFVTP